MASLLPDVSFPLFGSGSSATVTDRMRMRLLSLSGTTIDAGWNHDDFTAPYWRIYLNLDDGVETSSCGHLMPLRAGHLYVVPAWLRWSGQCRGRVRHLNASLDLPNLPRDRVLKHLGQIIHLGGPPQALPAAWLGLGEQLAHTAAPGAELVARSYALAYASVAAALAQAPKANDLIAVPGSQILSDLVGRIEHDLGRPLSLAVLADMAGCSQSELSRRFRSTLGTSPVQWVRQRRVAVAADLLRCTDASIEAIAHRCGFSDRSRFSKLFRSYIGCGPATWRRNLR